MSARKVDDQLGYKLKQTLFRLTHRCPSLAGIVLRSINCVIASAGMRTALPQLTRGSFLLNSHALTVETFRFNISAVSATVSKFFIRSSFRARAANWCACIVEHRKKSVSEIVRERESFSLGNSTSANYEQEGSYGWSKGRTESRQGKKESRRQSFALSFEISVSILL
jgi:hypothetical protein